MCHFAVKIEEKCAFLAHRNIGLIMFVIFVIRTIWRLVCESMRVRVYRGIWYTHTRYVSRFRRGQMSLIGYPFFQPEETNTL